MSPSTEAYHAWNPGVLSAIPGRFLPLASLFRPNACAISFESVAERSSFTGLEPDELAVYRPERIALHSLLIRVTANVAVSDGERYEDLGINFRRIAARLEQSYLTPLMPDASRLYQELGEKVRAVIETRLQAIMPAARAPSPVASVPNFRQRWFPWLTPKAAPLPAIDPAAEQQAALLELRKDAERQTDGLSWSDVIDVFCARALDKLLSSIAIRHGRIAGDKDVVADIAFGLAMNVLASKRIGERVEQGFAQAVIDAGYALLPSQERTVVFNTKGASAAGKSTLRPRQQELVRKLGYRWQDFALISPDIWRKYLLDYEDLGEAWRYAGSLSGMELRVVDHKLDLYMATRQKRQRCPHLLIDRFRFDSFQMSAANKGEERLLTRFGDEVYMMFMITPPESLVQRAWLRGLEVGRFKPVDDLLDHCVEAYQGMPPLFFRWATRKDKDVSYEFLDNSVAKGEVPRTVALGSAGKLTILSIEGMLNINRFARINLHAKDAADLWPKGEGFQPQDNGFLKQCAERLDELSLADPGTGLVYARLARGQWRVLAPRLWQERLKDHATARVFDAMAPAREALEDQGSAIRLQEIGGQALGQLRYQD